MFSINPGRRDGCVSLILSAAGEQVLAQRSRKQAASQAWPGSAAAQQASAGLVHIHAFYPELLAELLEPIAQHWPGAPPSLWITVPGDGSSGRLKACQAVMEQVFSGNAPRCRWLEVENRGRNLLPLLQVLGELAQQPSGSARVPWLLHLHTKKTLDASSIGDRWRRDLLQKLIGSREQISTALQLLSDPASTPPVGLVTPTRFPGIERHYHWGGNFQLATDLVAQLFPGRSLHPDQLLQFPAGLMFWCRPAALLPLLSLPQDTDYFPAEPLGTNGTVPHALERLLCHTVEAAGWQWRLLDRADSATAAPADNADVTPPTSMPSVWERHSAHYPQLLSQRLREQQQQLQRQQEQQEELALQWHQRQRQEQRRPPWQQRPLEVALVLQKAGKGYISSAHLRLLEPLRLLEQRGLCQARIVDQPDLANLAGSDVVIAQRGALADTAAAEALHQLCQQLELRLITDLDDALCLLPEQHSEQQRYQSRSAATDRLLEHCDHAIFSTAVLEQTYRAHLARCGLPLGPSSVIANGLSPRLWRPEQQGLPPRRPLAATTAAAQPLQLLYMGSATHDDDFQMLLPQLDALQAQHPGRFQLHVIGALSHTPERPWLQQRPVPLQVRRYPEFVRWLLQRRPYHGGIAPLRSHPFNAAKSDVKVLDYAALGLGCLCSSGPAYDRLIARGLALGTSNDSWQQALSALLEDPRPLQRCGRRAARHLWRQRSCARVADQLWRVLRRDR